MSVQKLHTVPKSRKDQGECGKCHEPLPAGTAYRWWQPGFRARSKYKRCMKPECTPSPAERETSKAATILFAQEAFNKNVETLDTVDDIQDAVREVADAVAEVRDEYQEVLDGWENGNEQFQEKVDHYEEQLREIESWNWDGPDSPEPCEEHEDDEDGDGASCEDCIEIHDQWIGDCRQAAEEVVNAVETA